MTDRFGLNTEDNRVALAKFLATDLKLAIVKAVEDLNTLHFGTIKLLISISVGIVGVQTAYLSHESAADIEVWIILSVTAFLTSIIFGLFQSLTSEKFLSRAVKRLKEYHATFAKYEFLRNDSEVRDMLNRMSDTSNPDEASRKNYYVQIFLFIVGLCLSIIPHFLRIID